MVKRITSILVAFIIGFFAVYGTVNSVVTPVFAAEQITTQEQPQQPDTEKKDKSSEHSGHHG